MNKYSFLRGVCDVIFFSAILLNLGALGLTNIVVVKENPQAVVLEANPITAQAHGYVVHPETAKPKNFLLKTYLPLFLSALSMASLLTYYVYIRYFKHTKVWLLLFYSSLCFFLLASDFINNLGIFIGLRVYGCG